MLAILAILCTIGFMLTFFGTGVQQGLFEDTVRFQDVNGDPCHGLAVDRAKGQPRPPASMGELVLVTGGAGFIGSHLVEQLLTLGYAVRVLDNLETGNLQFLDLRHPRLEFQMGDIMDVEALRRAMVGVRGVFHLAAASKVLPSLKSPSMGTFNVERNAVGSSRVLEIANETNMVRKVVYAASSTYYGNQKVPFTETDPFMPTSPYASSKYMGELSMQTNDALYNLPTLSIRFFMVFGPRNPATGAYAIVTGKFLQRKKELLPLLIEGTGDNYRDFIHVKDIARVLILGYQSTVHGTVINAGTGEVHSVKEVANLVSDYQEHVAPRKNDLLGTRANTCRARQLLNFEAEYDFVATMKTMVADASAGKDDLAPMWKDPQVVGSLDARLPGWRGLSVPQRADKIKAALERNPLFLKDALEGVSTPESREAWVTIFSAGDASPASTTNYILATLTLERSLRRFERANARRPFLVVHDSAQQGSEERALRIFRENGLTTMPVEIVKPPYVPKKRRNLFSGWMMRIRLWNMTQFTRIVHLDSDMVVVGDIEPLFASGAPHSDYLVSSLYPATQLRSLNVGVFSLRPSAAVYNLMLQNLHAFDDIKKKPDLYDQGWFDMFFHRFGTYHPEYQMDIASHTGGVTPVAKAMGRGATPQWGVLPPAFNLYVTGYAFNYTHVRDVCAEDTPRIIHWPGTAKPWCFEKEPRIPFDVLWWEAFAAYEHAATRGISPNYSGTQCNEKKKSLRASRRIKEFLRDETKCCSRLHMRC